MHKQIPSLHDLERYRNKGTRTYSPHADYTEAGDLYRPDSEHDRFELLAFALPRELVSVYQANPSQDLVDMYLGGNRVLFPVHPQVLAESRRDPYLKRIHASSSVETEIPVTPSSSTRTLFVHSQGTPHALKVHFPFRISRYTRKMRAEVIEQAINVSRELERGINRMDARFAFLREVIGVALCDQEPDSERGENWGYLVREMVPFPPLAEVGSLIPGFALYGEDTFDPASPPLLYELLGDQDPVTFMLERIMLPIVRHWVTCFLNFGYLIEPHGQNVLLELDKSNAIRRIVHRDLSVGIDLRRRRENGLPNDQLNSYNLTEHGAFHSIAYDKFMGGHFFDRLVEVCRGKYPAVKKSDFTEPCQAEFARIFPGALDYFPETVWYFSEKRDQYNKPLYRDTGATPEWRP